MNATARRYVVAALCLCGGTVLADEQRVVYAPLSGHYNVWKSISGSYAWENGSKAKCGQDDVNYSSDDRLARGYLFLDLSEIPSGATIKSARITTFRSLSQNGNIVGPVGVQLHLCYFPGTLSASYLWTRTDCAKDQIASFNPEDEGEGKTISNFAISSSTALSILQSGFGKSQRVALVMKWGDDWEDLWFRDGIYDVKGTTDDDWYNTAQATSIEIVYTPAIEMTRIEIAGPKTVDSGGTAQYTCTAYYDNGTSQNVSTTAGWGWPEGQGIDSISSTGLLRAKTVYTDISTKVLAAR